MNTHTPIGHNNPPSDIDDAIAPYADAIDEAQNWLDGQEVTDEAAMKAVDAILKDIRAAHKAVTVAEKSATAPLHDAWKAEKARFKPTVDDLDRMKKGLAGLVDGFKRRLAQKREAERREAERKAREAQEKAAAAAREAQATDIEAMRAADEAQREAIEATKAAKSVEKVKGLRTVTRYEVEDHRALLHFIAINDRDAITAFIDEWARRNHREHRNADGLRVWDEKAAY